MCLFRLFRRIISKRPSFLEKLGINESLAYLFRVLLLMVGKFEILRRKGSEPPQKPHMDDSCTVSPTEPDDSAAVLGRFTLEGAEHAKDDTAVSNRPSRHVDYLSHDWREEDIWSSWRYIVSRRSEFADSSRLENACWRTWMKARNDLKTISADEINWFKDYDVTWLYGPLRSCSKYLNSTHTEPSSVLLSKMGAFDSLTNKTILKKRSMSEIMLLQLLASGLPLKQATGAVRLASKHRTDHFRTDFSPPSTQRASPGSSSSVGPSTELCNLTPQSGESKHIRFHEEV